MFNRCVLDGDLNASFVDDVWSNIERLSEAKEDVILDLSRVDFIDSHGVGAVVALIEAAGLQRASAEGCRFARAAAAAVPGLTSRTGLGNC